MKPERFKLGISLLISTLATGCGSPGVPLPPSLEVARPVTDLRASRKGDTVRLTWTAPSQTMEGRNIRRFGLTKVCRKLAMAVSDCAAPIGSVPTPRSAGGSKQDSSYTDQLPPDFQRANATEGVSYVVSVFNAYGRSAGFSNQVQVPAAPTVSPPANLRAQVLADGVHLSWDPIQLPELPGLSFVCRIYRREKGSANDVIAGEVPALSGSPALTDQSFEWEKTYDYRATVVTLIGPGSTQQVEGEDTSVAKVFAHDVFPPATPTGIQAVFSGPGQKPFVDLIWSPDTDADLAGYNVYRHEQGSEPVKLNSELITAPAFRDAAVEPGREYLYSVSAVDLRGNESARSAEERESVPAGSAQ